MAGRPPARRSDRDPWDGGYRGYRPAESWDEEYEDPRGWADVDRRGWAEEDRRGWAEEDRRRRADGDRRGWAEEDRRGWPDENGPDGGYPGAGYQETRIGRAGYRRDTTGGAEGNERLTGLTGSLLLVLFAAEGVTILSLHQLLTLHFFLGMLLIGPVALKACAVLYRFAQYYTGAPEYRRKGPPAPLLRVLGPAVMITSLSVLGTGVMLAITGPGGLGTWLFLHRASFVLWFGVMTVHVLAYVWRLPQLVGSDMASRAGHRAQEVLAGRSARWLLLAASVLTGLLLAVLTVHRTGAWFGAGH